MAETFSIRIDPETRALLEAMAKANDRSKGGQLRYLIHKAAAQQTRPASVEAKEVRHDRK